MNIQTAITANRVLVKRAQELNLRAGEEVFPVSSREELTKLFAAKLGGARRVEEIADLSAILLPSLDQEMVKLVLEESPDTITILGQEVAVEYRSGYSPRARLDFRGDEGRSWLKLPDAGIHLPGGREVSMYCAVEGYRYYIEANSSQFKAKARECLNQGLWDSWRKPELPAPTESIAPVVEMEYGRCVVTDASLIAYGAVNYDSYYGSWKPHWSRDRAEADKVHAQACAKFVELREKIARDALKKRVGELYSSHGYDYELPQELRTRMHNTYYGYSGGAITVAEIEAFIVKVEVAVAMIAERKVETERVRIARERSGWQEARRVCRLCPVKVELRTEGGFSELLEGVEVWPEDGIEDWVYEDEEFESSYGRRPAQVAHFEPCLDGILEFLVYHKYGDWNMVLRWRELEGGEVLPKPSWEEKPKDTHGGGKSVDLSRIDLGDLFGGAAR